jgi:DNA-binding IclR family transcriptional regulator
VTEGKARSSVEQAVGILMQFVGSPERQLGVSDVSRLVGVPLSTTHRVLSTLVDSGLLAQEATGGKYTLGLGIRELILRLCDGFPIRRVAAPYLRRLAALSGQNVGLDVRLGLYAYRIGGVQQRQGIHLPMMIGEVSSLCEGLGSLTLLAYQSERVVDECISRFRVLDSTSLLELLHGIRRAGYTMSSQHDANYDSVRGISFPVRIASGEAIAAMSVEGPVLTFPALAQENIGIWRSVVEELESHCSGIPDISAGPFSGLSDDLVEIAHLTERASVALP